MHASIINTRQFFRVLNRDRPGNEAIIVKDIMTTAFENGQKYGFFYKFADENYKQQEKPTS